MLSGLSVRTDERGNCLDFVSLLCLHVHAHVCLPVALTEHPQPLSIWNSSTDKSLYALRVNVPHFLFQQHGKGENAGEEDKHPAPSVLSTAVHHILTLTSRINQQRTLVPEGSITRDTILS